MKDHSGKRIQTRQPPDQTLDSYLALLLSEVDAPMEEPAEPEKSAPALAPIKPEVTITPNAQPVQDAGRRLVSLRRSGVEIPAWGRTAFQCLIFKVRGLTLAAPLVAIDSITLWQDKIKAIPGQSDWHLGVVLYRGKHVVAVDTARLIMPDRQGVDSMHGGSYLLIIGEYRWGLVCDALQRPITLGPGSVHWRRRDNIEPWIAGIVTDKLYVLLNIEALIEVFR